MFLSHPAIDCLPVVAIFFIFYIRSMPVSDFKNVFKCTNKNSSSGRAFSLNRCSCRISDCSCRRLKLSLFLLLFLSSSWKSLFRCSHNLIWNRRNNSIIFVPHTNDDRDLVDLYRCSHLSLNLPQNMLCHPILA